MDKTITITIPRLGNVKIEADGFEDESCALATKQIEKALGSVEKVAKKDTYNIPASEGEAEQERLTW